MPLHIMSYKSRTSSGKYALRPPVDRTGQTPRLARQMELEVQVEQMLERFPSNLADRVLSDTREGRIQKLTE